MTKNESSALCASTQGFDFEAMHNGVRCIESLASEDRGTARQYRFTARGLAELFECKFDTIQSRIKALVDSGDLNDSKNLESLNVRNDKGNGAVKTTIYDLDVFNKVAMTFIDNPKAVEIRKAFNDVLVRHETRQDSTPHDYLSALKALVAEVEAKQNAQRALEAEIVAHEADMKEARRTKAHFIEGRDAEMCGRVGGLTKENDRLRTEIGDSRNWKQVKAIKWLGDYFALSKGLFGAIAYKLKGISEELELPRRDIEDSQYGTVKIYHVKAIEELHGRIDRDKNYLSKYRKVA